MKKTIYYVVYVDENGIEITQEDTECETLEEAEDLALGFNERNNDKGSFEVRGI